MKKIKFDKISIGNLQTGDVILFHTPFNLLSPGTWLPVFIRFFQRNRFNHAALFLRHANLSCSIIEAKGKGVLLSDAFQSLYNADIAILRHYSFADSDYADFNSCYEKAMSLLLIKYDFAGCLFHQLVKQVADIIDDDINFWIGPKNKNAARRFYCSELVAFILNLQYWYSLSPADLYNNKNLFLIFQGKFEI